MTVYVVAQLRFTDRAAYDRYQSRFPEVFRRHEGRTLVSDEDPQVLEGSWDRDKLVVLAFRDEGAARGFLGSADYRAIEPDRKAGAEAIVLLAQGLPVTA